MAGKQKNSGRGQRELKASVKSARGRTVSQVKWLQRQLNDPYVKEQKRRVIEVERLIKSWSLMINLSSSNPDLGWLIWDVPGGWCQVVSERVNAQGNLKENILGKLSE